MKELLWIAEYIASFVEFFICGILCSIFLTKDRLGDRKYKIFLYSGAGAVIVIILNRIAMFSYINSIMVILTAYAMQMLIYKGKAVLTFLLVLVYSVVLSALDFVVVYFTAFLLHMDVGYILNAQSIDRVMCILVSKSLLTLIVVILNKGLKNSLVFLKKYVVVMGIYSIFLLTSFFIMVELNMYNKDSVMELFLVIFFIVSILIELLMFYFVIKTSEGYEYQQEVRLIEMKNRMLQKALDETEQAFGLWQRSIHDYKNNIIALRQLANDGNIEAIRKYLDCENELVSKKMFYIRTGNSVVDTIVNTKQSFAEEKGITFVVNAAIPGKTGICDMDMANILGNLIDNAIEASICEDKPYIDFTMRREKTFVIIRIVNKYTGDFFDVSETSKNNRTFHGIGIKSVRSILDKYNGEFVIEKKCDEVIAKVIIPERN